MGARESDVRVASCRPPAGRGQKISHRATPGVGVARLSVSARTGGWPGHVCLSQVAAPPSGHRSNHTRVMSYFTCLNGLERLL